jgi:NitT/TauT family transport system substrate-binding protein
LPIVSVTSAEVLQGSDSGYAVYASGLFTSEKLLVEKSDLVQWGIDEMTAFADVSKSPEEAADVVVEANPAYATDKDVPSSSSMPT